MRTGRRGDGPADLGEALERYLGEGGPQKQSDSPKQGGRRNRGGQGKSAQNQPRQERASQQQGQSKPRQQSAPQKQGQFAPEGEAKAGHKRRYRPHHRRKSGGGQAPQS